MYTRNLERVARDLKRQRCDVEYIRHYLMEEYQCDPPTVDRVLEKVGLVSHDPFAQKGKGGADKPKGFQRF